MLCTQLVIGNCRYWVRRGVVIRVVPKTLLVALLVPHFSGGGGTYPLENARKYDGVMKGKGEERWKGRRNR